MPFYNLTSVTYLALYVLSEYVLLLTFLREINHSLVL